MTINKTIGVLGLGSIGIRHATNLINMGHDVVAFDPDTTRQQKFINLGGQVGDKEGVLKSCSHVVIASPNEHHFSDLKSCVDHNCNAFVEKPLSHSFDGLEEIVSAAKHKKLNIIVGMNIRLNPAMIALKSEISGGRLGKVLWGEYTLHSYLPDWRPHQDHRTGYTADPKTGGIIFDAIHGFDLLYFLFGNYIVKGSNTVSSGFIDLPSEDCADILCAHKGGVQSRLHMDYISKPKEHSVSVVTTEGFARVDISNRIYSFINHDGDIREKKSFTNTSVNDDYILELDHFINGHLDSCNVDEALVVLRQVIEARKIAGLPS